MIGRVASFWCDWLVNRGCIQFVQIVACDAIAEQLKEGFAASIIVKCVKFVHQWRLV